MIRDDAAEALAQAEFFDICDDEQRRMLAFAGDMHYFDPDAVLYKAGDMPQGAFVLIEGTLKAKPEGPGAGKPYAISEPGSVVSAMALILAKPRPVTITAVTDVRTLFVPRTAFLKLVQQSPDLAQRAVARVERDLGNYLDALEPVRRKMKTE
ncbi:cyclic nucleotide-binding domain-containing protein [Devosia ginsengisoli]|uniref:Cyclic nucleotide-binding domain-containing protein n=1 Tax=Devosia ginsengisoli TaxID=400770 RepID=A0A5B8LXE8_9HYPH|nr:cyclic nucleotide-binding domain-containing protein [Devosia ginsengisoli]QDZ12162.1 cyclic nucleotide-binding domain-containing protein [Devosia ginsengisoli]